MKTIIAVLTLILFLAHSQAAAPTVAIGSIVTISGRITHVDPEAGTFNLGEDEIYYVTGNSTITVNGGRGLIANLDRGMKVTGSAEAAKGDSRFAPPKKIVRMLTATTAPLVPGRSPGFDEKADDLKRRITGTFWAIPYRENDKAKVETLWVSLNTDGTTTCSDGTRLGRWSVLSVSNVNVSYAVRNSTPFGTAVNFNAVLDKGVDGAFPPGERFAWKRITTPTSSMLAKAAQRPAPSDFLDRRSKAAAATPAPPSAETQQAAAELVRTNTKSLVFVSGKEGQGSGFIARLNGVDYLVTNAHVAAGINDANFQALDGRVVPRGTADAAVEHDVFRMALTPGGPAFEAMDNVDQNAQVGDEVVVLGNAEGSGVVNTIIGKIVGLSANLVETNAPFVPGNSGSPIIHLKTGKVIGVATYAVIRRYDDATAEKTKEPAIRRFGYRLDSVKTWEPVNWPAFAAQGAALEKIHSLTVALDDFFQDLSDNGNRVTIARHTHPAIRTRISQWHESRSHPLSAADRASANANFISFLKVASQADIAEVQRYITYDYFRRRLAGELQTRNEMAKAFSQVIENIRD